MLFLERLLFFDETTVVLANNSYKKVNYCVDYPPQQVYTIIYKAEFSALSGDNF